MFGNFVITKIVIAVTYHPVGIMPESGPLALVVYFRLLCMDSFPFRCYYMLLYYWYTITPHNVRCLPMFKSIKGIG